MPNPARWSPEQHAHLQPPDLRGAMERAGENDRRRLVRKRDRRAFPFDRRTGARRIHSSRYLEGVQLRRQRGDPRRDARSHRTLRSRPRQALHARRRLVRSDLRGAVHQEINQLARRRHRHLAAGARRTATADAGTPNHRGTPDLVRASWALPPNLAVGAERHIGRRQAAVLGWVPLLRNLGRMGRQVVGDRATQAGTKGTTGVLALRHTRSLPGVPQKRNIGCVPLDQRTFEPAENRNWIDHLHASPCGRDPFVSPSKRTFPQQDRSLTARMSAVFR